MRDPRRRSSSSSSSGSDSEHSEPLPGPAAVANGESGNALTSDQVEKLVQLGDLTGIDDLGFCRVLLESKNWDLEMAARAHLDPSPPPGSPGETPPIRPHQEPPEIRQRLFEGIQNPDPAPAQRRNSSGWLNMFVYFMALPVIWPFKFAFRAFSGIFSYLLGVDLMRSGPGAVARLPAVNALQEIEDFKRSFDAEYPGHGLEFFSGTYSQCLDAGKRDLRFIVAYLHCPAHQDTPSFVLDVMMAQDFKEFIMNQNCLLFGCDVETREGHRVSQAVRVNTYPTLAVIVLRQNRMMIVGRQEGYANAQQVVRKLTAVVSENEAYVVAARADRAEREMNESIRREQDLAFQETLRQDQEKERLKREKEEALRREHELKEAKERLELDRRSKIAKAKVEYASKLPEEPDVADNDAVRILIKLPEGQRLERRFLRTESLKYLFYYVFSHPDSPSNFDITTNFPRKVLPCRPSNFFSELGIEMPAGFEEQEEPPTFEDAGIKGSTMLFVNDLEA